MRLPSSVSYPAARRGLRTLVLAAGLAVPAVAAADPVPAQLGPTAGTRPPQRAGAAATTPRSPHRRNRAQPPRARGGGPQAPCAGPDRTTTGECIAPDLSPTAPQNDWDRNPRQDPPRQSNSPGPAVSDSTPSNRTSPQLK
jgi:hypothetical protein